MDRSEKAGSNYPLFSIIEKLGVNYMKLGFVSAILDQSTYEEMMDTASELG